GPGQLPERLYEPVREVSRRALGRRFRCGGLGLSNHLGIDGGGLFSGSPGLESLECRNGPKPAPRTRDRRQCAALLPGGRDFVWFIDPKDGVRRSRNRRAHARTSSGLGWLTNSPDQRYPPEPILKREGTRPGGRCHY